MNGYNKWNYAPYLPFDKKKEALKPYICRLAPSETALEIEWFDKGVACKEAVAAFQACAPGKEAVTAGEAGTTAKVAGDVPEVKYQLYYALRTSGDWKSLPVQPGSLTLTGLIPEADYEMYIEREDGVKSNTRLFRTGVYPGPIINYLHPADGQYKFSGQYIGSPFIIRLESGALLVSMDIFHGNSGMNLALLFRSDDEGKTWHYVTDLFPSQWGALFLHKDVLYMMSMSTRSGDLLIGASTDEGYTWTTPTVIMRGSGTIYAKGGHKTPMLPIYSHGRFWVSMDWGGWASGGFDTTLLSIDEDADFLNAENWCLAEPLAFDKNWPGTDPAAVACEIEGNALEGPDGSVVTMLRYYNNKALVLKNDPERPHDQPEFVKIADFPMGHSKFMIKKQDNGLYYAVGNRFAPTRTVLSVYTSKDLENWEFHSDILNYENMPRERVGVQYPSFIFDGDDHMLVVSRTAFNGSDTHHNSNCVTLHRVAL